MNFYKHHLGDYDGATSHLSWDEDMAYTRLMRVYYRDEKPLPLELRQVHRIARAQTKSQREAIETVLGEFFEKHEDGWHNKRCDEEIGQAAQQAATNRRIAEEREAKRTRPANGSSNGVHTDRATNRDESVNLSRLQTPDSNIQTPDLPTPTPPKGGEVRHRRISPERAEKDQALEVWNQLVASAGSKPPRDHRLQAAIDAVGGWSRIAQREQGIDAQRVQRDFVEAYRSVS